MRLHTESNIKHFNNDKDCPYEDLGCKFLHETSDLDDNSAIDFDSVVTSAPQKKIVQCEECFNRSQCTDCYVRQVMMTEHILYDGQDKPSHRNRVHFSDDE